MERKNTERFSNRVENYIQYRPSYPQALIDHLLSYFFRRETVIADIGSGTGIFAGLLLARGCKVVGVEPNREMREAGKTYLHDYPNFTAVDGQAENTGLASQSIDHITCAQAFHWFDLQACRKEFSRVLKPGGKVILVWNQRVVEESGFSGRYENLLEKYAEDYQDVNHREVINDQVFKAFYRHGFYEKLVFSNQQTFDFTGLKGRLLSSSYAPLPGHPDYKAMMIQLEQIFDRYNQQGHIIFKYNTEAYIGEV